MRTNHYFIGVRLPHFRMLKLAENLLRVFSRNHVSQFFHASPLDVREATKFLQRFLRGLWAHAGDFAQCGLCLPLAAPLPVECNRKSVGLIANMLNEVKDRRMPL